MTGSSIDSQDTSSVLILPVVVTMGIAAFALARYLPNLMPKGRPTRPVPALVVNQRRDPPLQLDMPPGPRRTFAEIFANRPDVHVFDGYRGPNYTLTLPQPGRYIVALQGCRVFSDEPVTTMWITPTHGLKFEKKEHVEMDEQGRILCVEHSHRAYTDGGIYTQLNKHLPISYVYASDANPTITLESDTGTEEFVLAMHFEYVDDVEDENEWRE